ncbi:hypothetical protein BS78_08G136800 [Paspalum vaginatum]|nr:hypothetical protein BS78_08G136800 [Paspalum vaginatum]
MSAAAARRPLGLTRSAPSSRMPRAQLLVTRVRPPPQVATSSSREMTPLADSRVAKRMPPSRWLLEEEVEPPSTSKRREVEARRVGDEVERVQRLRRLVLFSAADDGLGGGGLDDGPGNGRLAEPRRLDELGEVRVSGLGSSSLGMRPDPSLCATWSVLQFPASCPAQVSNTRTQELCTLMNWCCGNSAAFLMCIS